MISLQIILLWIILAATLMMAVMSWRRGSAFGARMLAICLLAIAWWVFCFSAESMAMNMASKLFWAHFKYIGITLLPPFMLGFVIQYTRRQAWPPRWQFSFLLIIPLVVLGVLAMDDRLHLFYNSSYLYTFNNTLHLANSPGPFFWVHTGYSYLLLLAGTILLARATRQSSGAQRTQQGIILFATLVPWAANALYLYSLKTDRMFDLTPLSFFVTGAAIFLALFYYRLLEIAPVARNAIVEHMLDGVIVLDMERRVMDLNPTMRNWLGKSTLQVVGHSIESVLPDLTAQHPGLNIEDHTSTQFVTTFHGERRILEARFSPIKNQNGQGVGNVLMLRDVTERDRVEQSLWKTNELLESMFNSINLLVIYLDAGLKVIRTNSVVTNLVGRSQEELAGTPITDIYPMFSWEKICKEVVQTGEMRSGEAEKVTIREKKTFWDWSMQPVRAQDGTVEGLLLAMIDVTKRKKAEEELRRSEQAEREQRLMAETFRDTSAALNSTIQIDSVLSLILSSIERVVEHAAAYVVLNDDRGNLVRWRFRGFTSEEEHDILEIRKTMTEPVSNRRVVPRQSSALLVPDVLYIPDVLQDPQWGQYDVMRKFRSYLGTPIRIKGRVAGFINLASEKPDVFNAEDAARLRVFADQAAIAVENARLYEEVEYLTLTDELTGVYNYRGLVELGQREFDRARRFNRPLSLMFFDIDHFRSFNNQYSHELGNMVLQLVAQTARSTVRGVDLVTRYGGEEFVILLPETDLITARPVAERVRRAVETAKIHNEYGDFGVTISIGVAMVDPDTLTLDALIRKANLAEHVAKKSGRNCVSLADTAELAQVENGDSVLRE